MTTLLVVFAALALASVPLTKMAVKRGPELDEFAWWLKAVMVPMSYALWAYLLFPVWIGAGWAEWIQREQPLVDTNAALKGMFLSICWLIVVCQFFYRMGREEGKREA